MKGVALPCSKLFSYGGRYIPHHEIGLERYNPLIILFSIRP